MPLQTPQSTTNNHINPQGAMNIMDAPGIEFSEPVPFGAFHDLLFFSLVLTLT